MPADSVDGMDVLAVEAATRARGRGRSPRRGALASSRSGPIASARTRCSTPSCTATRPRSRTGSSAIRSSCCAARLASEAAPTASDCRRSTRTSMAEIDAAVAVRRGRHVGAGRGPHEGRRTHAMTHAPTYREALRAALREALSRDPRVFLMGEDVGRYGGAYAVSKGLLDEFGPERIRDTPLSESAFVGAGIGAALGGMRPIVEVMTVNFSLLALDQIVNNAATIRHMSGGQFSVPAGDPHGDRRGPSARRAALAQPRRLVRAHPRHPHRRAGDARGRPRHALDRARGSRSRPHLRAPDALQHGGRAGDDAGRGGHRSRAPSAGPART